jgi:hypothetical protein
MFMIVSLPSMAFLLLLAWAAEGDNTTAKKIFFIPIIFGSFLFGTLVPVLFYSSGIFAVTQHFMRESTHPIVYAIVGGLLCLLIRAPSGEANGLGILTSVVSYILYMTILKTFGHNVSDMGLRIVSLFLAILLPVFSIGLVIALFSWIVSKTKRAEAVE